MNQKSSLREDLKFVSWMLTGNTFDVADQAVRQDDDIVGGAGAG
jgi:hypothetical protein